MLVTESARSPKSLKNGRLELAKYTKFEQMSRVGSRDRHTGWRSKKEEEEAKYEWVLLQKIFQGFIFYLMSVVYTAAAAPALL